MKVAIIPARGGSKRIPRKNIKEFNGKPIIAWSILAAQESGLFDHVVVSTDDSEIKIVAEKYGATVPFIRPSDISDDNTPTVPVIAHAIKEINNFYQQRVEYACCIYPCSPLVLSSDLIKAYSILEESEEDFVYPVTEYAHSIFRSMSRDTSGKMKFLYPEFELTRTQDLERTFHDTGQFYWGRSDAWIQQKKMHTDGVGMEVPSYRVVDIDTEDDWKRAEVLFKMNTIY
jgi:pseudaminic acid cytidylyltransferase